MIRRAAVLEWDKRRRGGMPVVLGQDGRRRRGHPHVRPPGLSPACWDALKRAAETGGTVPARAVRRLLPGNFVTSDGEVTAEGRDLVSAWATK